MPPVIRQLVKHSQTSTIDTQITCFHRFLNAFDEDDVIPDQTDCFAFVFAENLEEKRTVVGTIGATGFEDDLLLSTLCDRVWKNEHTVQLLEKGDAVFRVQN